MGIKPRIIRSRGGRLNHWAKEAVTRLGKAGIDPLSPHSGRNVLLPHHQGGVKLISDNNRTMSVMIAVLLSVYGYRLVGLMVKASASGAEDPGFKSRLQWDFSGWSHISDLKLALQWLPCQTPGVTKSAQGPSVSLL